MTGWQVGYVAASRILICVITIHNVYDTKYNLGNHSMSLNAGYVTFTQPNLRICCCRTLWDNAEVVRQFNRIYPELYNSKEHAALRNSVTVTPKILNWGHHTINSDLHLRVPASLGCNAKLGDRTLNSSAVEPETRISCLLDRNNGSRMDYPQFVTSCPTWSLKHEPVPTFLSLNRFQPLT